MNKEELIAALHSVETELNAVQNRLHNIKSTTVQGQDLKDKTNSVCRLWFDSVDDLLTQYNVDESTKRKYHELFEALLRLSLRTSWKNTYQKTIRGILDDYKDEIIVPVTKSSAKVGTASQLAQMPSNVTDEERNYLEEAIGCTNHGFHRGAIVLGWSAAIHRLHKVVEKLGLDEFNKKSQEMKKITEGRFKRFKKSFSVHSLSELDATVFDNDLLWVLEYWNLIDANQHERLSICFTMRNNSAHPGEAPISPENLASFFSDLKNIVFDNPKFKL